MAIDMEKLVRHINRKYSWHVTPEDPTAYKKRGKFLASTYKDAEFYGRPNDQPEKVEVKSPLVGDEETIAQILRVPPQHAGMTIEQIARHDAKWKRAALAKGYDSIVLLTPESLRKFRSEGKLPRSIELNILELSCLKSFVEGKP